MRPPAYDVPDAFRALGVFEPLRDASGKAFVGLPCSIDPQLWDEDATAIVKASSQVQCGFCPALLACRRRAHDLGPLATGVWGGMILASTPESRPLIVDATVARWMWDAGVSRTPREVTNVEPVLREAAQ